MADEERLADNAVVVRCGRPPFVDSPFDRGCRHHPDGFFGFSVQAAAGLTVEQLATVCRNKSVGFTTVAKIRTDNGVRGRPHERRGAPCHRRRPRGLERRGRGETRRDLRAGG
jgi:hypothetical protein